MSDSTLQNGNSASQEKDPRELESGRPDAARIEPNGTTNGATEGHAKSESSPTLKSSKPSHFGLVFSHSYFTQELLDHRWDGSGTEDDPYQVEFIDDDPRNPMEWSSWTKALLTGIVAMAVLAVAFTSSAYSGATKQVQMEFGSGTEVAILGVSLFVLGFVIGPLFWAPISELYGRQVVFCVSYGVLTAFNAASAGSQNMVTLIVLRFVAGVFGSSPLTNAGGVIADMYPSRKRGMALAIFSGAPFMGPCIGPIVGGFAGESIGWRWVQGIQAIFTGVLWIAGCFLVPETYAPVLLRKRAAKLSKFTGKVYRSRLECAPKAQKTSPADAFKKAMVRPWTLLFREPIVLLLSIYMAIVYGTLYMLFPAFPIVYQQARGWSQGIGGLAFIGVAVGFILAVCYAIWDNQRYARVEDSHKAQGELSAPPEARLPPAIIGSICLPVGLFWFAWTNSPSIHWSASIIGTAPFAFGMVLVFISIMNYLIDAYTIYAASVLAANSVLRSLFGAAFPLFTTYMFQNLGIHWASSIPAFLALMCVPFPFLFWNFGPRIRKKCKYAREALEEMERLRDMGEHKTVEEESSEGGEPDGKNVEGQRQGESEGDGDGRDGSGEPLEKPLSRVSTRKRRYDQDSQLERARSYQQRW